MFCKKSRKESSDLLKRIRSSKIYAMVKKYGESGKTCSGQTKGKLISHNVSLK